MIKQSAPFGSHSRKGLVAKALPAVGDGSPSHRRSLTKRDKSNDGNQGSPSHRRSWKKVAMVTKAPPVVGEVGQRRRGLSQKLEMAPPVVGGAVCRDEQKQKTAPVVGNGSNRCRRSQTKSGNVNNSSPSCWRRRTTAETDHLVVGRDGQRQQRQQFLPQLSAETDGGGNGSPSCWWGRMVGTPNAYWHTPQRQR
jgi:hypothetical protein